MPPIINSNSVNGTTKVAVIGPSDIAGGSFLYSRAFYPTKKSDGTVAWLDDPPTNPLTQYNMAILKDNVFNNSVLSSFLSKSGDTSDGTLAASNLQPLLGFNRVGESSKTLADTVTIARSGQLLFLTVNVATVNDDATFNTSTDTKALSTALKNAQTQLASSQADLATANATQAAAQSAFDQANGAQTKAQANYNDAVQNQKAASVKKTSADNKVAVNKVAVTNAETALATAQKIYEASLQDRPAKIAALNAAKTAQAEAEKQLSLAKSAQATAEARLEAAQNQLKKDQDATADAKAKLAKAEQAVTDAKAKLDQLNHAQDRLIKAKEAQAKADAGVAKAKAAVVAAEKNLSEKQAVLADAKAKAATAKNKLAEATASLTAAQQQLKTAKSVLKAAQDAETLADNVTRQQHQLESKADALKHGYHINGQQVLDQNGHPVSGWSVVNGQMVDPYGNIIKIAQTQTTPRTKTAAPVTKPLAAKASVNSNGRHSFPQTGENQVITAWMMLLGFAMTALSMLGFESHRKYRHQR
jgi:hypothetical protein